MSWVVVGVTVASSIYKGYQANKAGNAAAAEQKRANAEMAEQKRKLQALDMSNPYENMQNTMEDLTINQQQTDYLTQQAQINQANTMQALQGAAGGSGIGSLAQSLYNQGQLASQKTGAMIGQQESANQKAMASQAAANQRMKAQGKQWSINKQQEAITGQLNNARADKQAADTAANNAATAQQQAVMSGVGGVAAGVSTGLDNTQDGGNFFTGN
tara:strand:+ start:4482 stop:5126 length:645 start_codon:yes stop_codon:yes gene_type:complete